MNADNCKLPVTDYKEGVLVDIENEIIREKKLLWVVIDNKLIFEEHIL